MLFTLTSTITTEEVVDLAAFIIKNAETVEYDGNYLDFTHKNGSMVRLNPYEVTDEGNGNFTAKRTVSVTSGMITISYTEIVNTHWFGRLMQEVEDLQLDW